MLIISLQNEFDPNRTADIILQEFKNLRYTGTRWEGDANRNDEEDAADTAEHCEDEDAAAVEDEEDQCQASEGEQQSSGNVRVYKFDANQSKFAKLDLQNLHTLADPKHHEA